MAFFRYIGVDLRFGLLDCVRYNQDFVHDIEVRYIEALFHTFQPGCRISFVIPRTSLYRGSLNRG